MVSLGGTSVKLRRCLSRWLTSGISYDLRACVLEGGDVAVAWHDVTEQTRALREADHRKDEFLAVLGHELRNPLAALNTAISLEQRRSADHDASTLRHIDLIRSRSTWTR